MLRDAGVLDPRDLQPLGISDTDGDGIVSAAEAAFRVKANTLYAFINGQ